MTAVRRFDDSVLHMMNAVKHGLQHILDQLATQARAAVRIVENQNVSHLGKALHQRVFELLSRVVQAAFREMQTAESSVGKNGLLWLNGTKSRTSRDDGTFAVDDGRPLLAIHVFTSAASESEQAIY